MFRVTVSPIFSSTLTVYTHSFLEQCTDSAVCSRPATPVTPNGITGVPGRQQTADSVHCSKKLCVYTVKVLLKMGETVARNM